MLLVWLLGSGVHSAVTVEVRPTARSQNPRALPRPFLRDAAESDRSNPVAPAVDELWLTSSAIGLLVVTGGIALLRPRRCGPYPDKDLPDKSMQVP